MTWRLLSFLLLIHPQCTRVHATYPRQEEPRRILGVLRRQREFASGSLLPLAAPRRFLFSLRRCAVNWLGKNLPASMALSTSPSMPAEEDTGEDTFSQDFDGLLDEEPQEDDSLLALSAILDEAKARKDMLERNLIDPKAVQGNLSSMEAKEINLRIVEQRLREESVKHHLRSELSRRITAAKELSMASTAKKNLAQIRGRFDELRDLTAQQSPRLIASGAFPFGDPVWMGHLGDESALASITSSGYICIYRGGQAASTTDPAATVTRRHSAKEPGKGTQSINLVDFELLVTDAAGDVMILDACQLPCGDGSGQYRFFLLRATGTGCVVEVTLSDETAPRDAKPSAPAPRTISSANILLSKCLGPPRHYVGCEANLPPRRVLPVSSMAPPPSKSGATSKSASSASSIDATCDSTLDEARIVTCALVSIAAWSGKLTKLWVIDIQDALSSCIVRVLETQTEATSSEGSQHPTPILQQKSLSAAGRRSTSQGQQTISQAAKRRSMNLRNTARQLSSQAQLSSFAVSEDRTIVALGLTTGQVLLGEEVIASEARLPSRPTVTRTSSSDYSGSRLKFSWMSVTPARDSGITGRSTLSNGKLLPAPPADPRGSSSPRKTRVAQTTAPAIVDLTFAFAGNDRLYPNAAASTHMVILATSQAGFAYLIDGEAEDMPGILTETDHGNGRSGRGLHHLLENGPNDEGGLYRLASTEMISPPRSGILQLGGAPTVAIAPLSSIRVLGPQKGGLLVVRADGILLLYDAVLADHSPKPARLVRVARTVIPTGSQKGEGCRSLDASGHISSVLERAARLRKSVWFPQVALNRKARASPELVELAEKNWLLWQLGPSADWSMWQVETTG